MAFKRKDPQALFGTSGFTVTKTLFEGPALSFLPDIYQDERARRWAVAYHGAVPAIFSYDDVLDAQLIEDGSLDISAVEDKKTLFKQIVTNPARVSRAGAGADGSMCPGLTLKISVRSSQADNGVAELSIPIITHPVRTSSLAYKQLVQFGSELKGEFLAMRSPSSQGGSPR